MLSTASQGARGSGDRHEKCRRNLSNQWSTERGASFSGSGLVLNVLLQALEDGNNVQELQEKLDALPDDLDQLYLRMLQPVNDGLNKDPRTRQRKLAEIAQLFLVADSARAPLTLKQLFCVIDEDIDPESSFTELFTLLDQLGPLPNLHEHDVLHRRLKALCGGILEFQA